jgi:hypothetical protein
MNAQAMFAQALLDPTLIHPQGLTCWSHVDPTRRFSVYRNNVRASLVNALADTFPVIQALVGEEFFGAMAQVFVQTHPPRTRVLTWYGEEFSDFIAQFEPAACLAYLPDMARLEMLRVRSYHAADARPMDVQALTDQLADPEALVRLELVLHPSVHSLESRYAVHALWSAHQGAIDIARVDPMQAEAVLIYRQGLNVVLQEIRPAQHQFLQRFRSSQHLAKAAHEIVDLDPEFDLPTLLALLIRQQLIVHTE